MSTLEIIASLGANVGLFAKVEGGSLLLIEFAWKKRHLKLIISFYRLFCGTLFLESVKTLAVFHIHLEVNGQVSGF